MNLSRTFSDSGVEFTLLGGSDAIQRKANLATFLRAGTLVALGLVCLAAQYHYSQQLDRH